MKPYSAHDVNEFLICCGFKGYLIKQSFANYFLHMSDVTVDTTHNEMEVHDRRAEPCTVTPSSLRRSHSSSRSPVMCDWQSDSS